MGCLIIFILMIVVLMGIMLTALAIAIGGTIGMVLFGDVIILVLFIRWLIKRRSKKR